MDLSPPYFSKRYRFWTMRLVKKSNRNKTSAPEGELTLRKEEPPGTKKSRRAALASTRQVM